MDLLMGTVRGEELEKQVTKLLVEKKSLVIGTTEKENWLEFGSYIKRVDWWWSEGWRFILSSERKFCLTYGSRKGWSLGEGVQRGGTKTMMRMKG